MRLGNSNISLNEYAYGYNEQSPDGETYQIPVEPIIDIRTYELFKLQRERNKTNSPQPMRHDYLLSGGALVRTKQAGLEFPGWIRTFWQKKTMNEANAVKTQRFDPIEQDKKQKQILPDSGMNTIGGWGYFIIGRGEDLSPDSSAIPHNCSDLDRYKEGKRSWYVRARIIPQHAPEHKQPPHPATSFHPFSTLL